jgi:hypothetical protein
MRATRFALAGALLAAAPAAAQQAPAMFPTRDVAITYRSVGGGQAPPLVTAMAWIAARKMLRMDIPGIGWSVANHGATPPSGFIVMQEARRVMDMPAAVLARQLGAQGDARFTREGTERIAGHACTLWRFQSADGEGQVCMTADGVMLRSAGTLQGQPTGIEATEVTYAAQDPARFELPAGYDRVQPRQPRERPAR